MNELLTLKNRLTEVEIFQRRLEEMLRRVEFSDDLVHDLSLVCEEVLVNIVHYAHKGQPDVAERDIQVRVAVDSQRQVHLEFRDDGVAFNPLLVEDRDPDDDRVGGWGIPMLRNLSDKVEYSRQAHENVLSLTRGERDS